MKSKAIKIPIDGSWTLDDLYTFPRTYSQVYGLVYALEATLNRSRVDYRENAFTKHPWRGGYSAVNFYNNLHTLTPRDERPQVVSLQYASPGWIELTMVATVARNIKKIVKAFCAAGREIADLYDYIQKGITERELRKIEVQRKKLDLDKETIAFIKESGHELAEMMDFPYYEEINEITKNPLTTLKILLSFYRRIRTLVEYEKSGRAKLASMKPSAKNRKN
ncbi:hypothetical protein [Cerasicoccus maritimus]|uniref:hypothetical protein n=1 Tax=Cerasicoccus maritimus TaxID=490089 RepID=UPI002852A917|nr:hypothetical protein [Cerasicoccus maritimus]